MDIYYVHINTNLYIFQKICYAYILNIFILYEYKYFLTIHCICVCIYINIIHINSTHIFVCILDAINRLTAR